MNRYFEEQQEYINTLQTQLDKGRADRDYVTGLFPESDGRTVYEGDGCWFVVELKPYYRTWGKSRDEHDAWSKARQALYSEGVLTAFPENGQEVR